MGTVTSRFKASWWVVVDSRQGKRAVELVGIYSRRLCFPFGFRLCESLCLLFHFKLGVHTLLTKSNLRFVGSEVSGGELLSQAHGWPHQRRWPGF